MATKVAQSFPFCVKLGSSVQADTPVGSVKKRMILDIGCCFYFLFPFCINERQVMVI